MSQTIYQALGETTAKSLLDKSKSTDRLAADLQRSAYLLEQSGGHRRDLPSLIKRGLSQLRSS